MRAAGDAAHGRRLRGLIVGLWRAGVRIPETLAPNETDLDPDRGALGRPSRQRRSTPRSRHGRVALGAPSGLERLRLDLPIRPPFASRRLARQNQRPGAAGGSWVVMPFRTKASCV